MNESPTASDEQNETKTVPSPPEPSRGWPYGYARSIKEPPPWRSVQSPEARDAALTKALAKRNRREIRNERTAIGAAFRRMLK